MDNLNQEIQTLDEQRQLRNLANAVRLSDSFSLLFVRCNQRPRQKEIIEELKGELVGYKIKVVFLENQIEHLLDELQGRLVDEKPDAIFVYGLESSFPKADEAAESKFVVTLNHSRNSFKRVLDCPLVLFLPEYALSAIYHGATDFYSIRSGVYLFSAKAEETEQLITRHASEAFWDLDGLLFEERQNRIKTVEDLLSEYQSLPDGQRNLKKEAELKIKLAALYYTSGEYGAADRIYQENIKYSKNAEDISLLSQSLNGLALVYEAQSKYEEALEIQKENIKLDEQIYGTKHHEYAISLSNLGSIYHRQDKLDEAAKLYQKALSIIEETIGTNHPVYSDTLNQLAANYHEQGNYDEAINLYEKSLSIIKETLGEHHLHYANRLNNLAWTYLKQEKYRKALESFEKAHRICVKTLGRNNFRSKNIKILIDECRTSIKEQASLLVPYKN